MNEMITFFKRYPQFVKQAESLQDASFYNEESFAFVVALKFLLHPQMIVIVKKIYWPLNNFITIFILY